MLSHKYKCIFVEVPKTGSTSIRDVIGHPKKAHLDIWQIKHEMENDRNHYQLLTKVFLLFNKRKIKEIGENRFKAYFKFGFVRNPWDRVVSLYIRKGRKVATDLSFEEFVEWINLSSDTCIHPTPHKNQLDWFTDPDRNVIVDFIGKFEKLEEDWKFICSKLGINVALPHSNKNESSRKHYTEYYTDKTKRIIGEKFKVDIEYFGYKFSPF